MSYNEDMNDCCNKCGKTPCGCNPCGVAKPVIDVQALPDDPLTLTFNVNGVGTEYDFRSIVQQGQTDTSITVDQVKRVLTYMAERHTDTISAKELGSILHISDLGDVDISNVDSNSLFVYQKNSDCSRGCDGVSNKWTGWNATENLVDSFQYIAGFDAAGAIKSLSTPANTDQYYQLGWNADGKTGWSQPVGVVDTTNLVPVYMDKTTKRLVFIEGGDE